MENTPHVLILWMTYGMDSIAVTSAEFDSLSAAAAAGQKVLEKAPLTDAGTPSVRWVAEPKALA